MYIRRRRYGSSGTINGGGALILNVIKIEVKLETRKLRKDSELGLFALVFRKNSKIMVCWHCCGSLNAYNQ